MAGIAGEKFGRCVLSIVEECSIPEYAAILLGVLSEDYCFALIVSFLVS